MRIEAKPELRLEFLSISKLLFLISLIPLTLTCTLIAAQRVNRIQSDLQIVLSQYLEFYPSNFSSTGDDRSLAEGEEAAEGENTCKGSEEAVAQEPEKNNEEEAPEIASCAGEEDHEEEEEDELAYGVQVLGPSSGEIGPHSEVRLELTWAPEVPDDLVRSEFLLRISDSESEDIEVAAIGVAVDVPVWVERESVDLRVCMYDRLYQDTVVVNNRASTALRLKFEVRGSHGQHFQPFQKFKGESKTFIKSSRYARAGVEPRKAWL